MTSFLRFFLLALTPLLAVTSSLGPAVLYGLAATLVLVAVSALAFGIRDQMEETPALWAALGLSVVLVTLLDIVVSSLLPGVRAVWGIYLNLLAFSPLVLLPLERGASEDWGPEISDALQRGGLLTLLFAVTALVREPLGLGSLTLLPGVALKLPLLGDHPLTIFATGAGGFFLAAAAVVAYRLLRPHLPAFRVQEFQADAYRPTPIPTPAAPLPETTDDWGESLAGVIGSLPSAGRRRLLVIGSGNGELAYYLSMLCLEQSKTDKTFDFRIRGVDHFATRIETAVKGVYREHHIEFIPKKVRDAWMTRGSGEDRLWRVDNEPRLHVQFDVADFQQGPLFFPQPCNLIVLNQGIEYVSDEKKVQLLKTVCDQLLSGGALVVTGPFRRELLPEGMKRTGTTVFRKS